MRCRLTNLPETETWGGRKLGDWTGNVPRGNPNSIIVCHDRLFYLKCAEADLESLRKKGLPKYLWSWFRWDLTHFNEKKVPTVWQRYWVSFHFWMKRYFLDSLSHLFQLLAITGRPLSSPNLLMLTSANMSDPDYDTPGWFWQEFSETPRHIVAHHAAVTRSTVAPSRQ